MKRMFFLIIVFSSFVSGCIDEPTPILPEIETSWYLDVDNDGHGDAAVEQLSTSKPNQYVADNTDCDDNNPAVNPMAKEINDGIDNNCDGVIDGEPFAIGDRGPAGGIVFYISNNGHSGLEAAPDDLIFKRWSCHAEWGIEVPTDGANGTAIGTGWQNTYDIIESSKNPHYCAAAYHAIYYSLHGHYGWHLPSRDELNALYSHKDIIPNLRDAKYWSSSEDPGNPKGDYAWALDFKDGDWNSDHKDYGNWVRPVRAF